MCFWMNKMSCGELLPINAVCLEESVVNQGNKPQSWRRRACCTQRHVAKKPSAVISSLQWPHKSGLQAVGGVDFSSIQRHLMLVAVYLARSHADAKWCQHLFVLPFGGSWSFFCFFMVRTLDAISPSCPNNLLICSCLCSLVIAPCRSSGLCHFASFSHILPVLSQQKCAHLHGLTGYLTVQNSLQFKRMDSSPVLQTHLQQERDAGLENSAFYFHAHALEVLLKWILFIL